MKAFLFSNLAWAETKLPQEPAQPSLPLPFPTCGPARGPVSPVVAQLPLPDPITQTHTPTRG
jgi:hypothetical protein